jgi:phenylalanine ammonia-lyase
VALSEEPAFRRRLGLSRELLESRIAANHVIYGVNTGYGSNSKYVIPDADLAAHQHNLLQFICCGVGEPFPEPVVRAAILLRANALARGFSGVRPPVIERLLDLLNNRISPVVPRIGSVGASGDLCPSAYIARVLTGGGEVMYGGRRMPAGAALRAAGLTPLRLEAKEGLALINGTSMMTGIAAVVLERAQYLLRLGLSAVAMTVEALQSSPEYFDPAIHCMKNHPGQSQAARFLRNTLAGSELVTPLDAIRSSAAERVLSQSGDGHTVELKQALQSPYSLRCAPQGLGPMLETLAWVRRVVTREANSANDNPLVDPHTGEIHHGGNFYGGHIARAMDGLKIDLANLANWMHSLMANLLDDRFSSGLPASLSRLTGTGHGFKGMQIVHTSLVAAIRHLAAPSLIHTLPTEQFNQDVVSLGTHAAATAMEITRMMQDLMAITLLTTSQAIELRRTSQALGDGTAPLFRLIRSVSPFVSCDRALDTDIAAICELIENQRLPVAV